MEKGINAIITTIEKALSHTQSTFNSFDVAHINVIFHVNRHLCLRPEFLLKTFYVSNIYLFRFASHSLMCVSVCFFCVDPNPEIPARNILLCSNGTRFRYVIISTYKDERHSEQRAFDLRGKCEEEKKT